MIGLVGTLRTEFSLRTCLFSRLQRTKLPLRKPTQDCNLFDIGCETFLYQSINVCTYIFCSYFCFMFSKCREKCQKVLKFDDFRSLSLLSIEVCCVKIIIKWAETWGVLFFSSYQWNTTQRSLLSETKNFGHQNTDGLKLMLHSFLHWGHSYSLLVLLTKY